MLVELRVVSRGDEVYLNPGGGGEDEDLEAGRHSEEEGSSWYGMV